TVTAHERAAAHEDFGRAAMARAGVSQRQPTSRDPARKLRIGWISSDFRDHPVARNLEPLLSSRNRAQFEAIGYSDVRQPDTITEWCQRQMDAWRPITSLSDSDVANQIRADQIDIMVYLAGRFDRNRPQIAAWRAAPLQVSLFDV